jgi:protein tyrosine phosphatase (PTP) superfamily phosphohydrolase (DUF442 family)
MAVAALLQTGCRSGGFFSPCGFVGRTTSKIMRPFRHCGSASPCGDAGGCYGSEIASDVPIEYAGPVGVVGPAMPLGPGAPIIEGGSVPSTVSPADSPTNLEAIPDAQPGPSPRSSRGSSSSGVRTPSSYDAQRPAGVSGRGAKSSHSLVSTPASTTARSSRDAIQASAKSVAIDDGDDDNVLDHLPPLDLPAEVTGRGDSPPVAPAVAKPRASAAVSTPAPASTSTVSPANDQLTGRSAREVGAALVAADAATPEAAAKAGDAIGITRFVAVDLNLAGGSEPSAVGLGWLAEKGYKTILDLRDSSRTNSTFIGEAAERGLRYVAFPVSLDKLNHDQLERFALELSLSDARPLYFFDDDGRRAGALWYLRRTLTDKVSPDIARREARELGLIDAASWKLVQEAVDEQLAPRSFATTIDDASPTAKPQPTTPTPPAETKPSTPAIVPHADLPTVAPTPVAGATRDAEIVARAALGGDPDAWQPIAAMILTGLTFPLAYFSRTVIPTMLARTRASLPAPARRSRSLPPASGA